MKAWNCFPFFTGKMRIFNRNQARTGISEPILSKCPLGRNSHGKKMWILPLGSAKYSCFILKNKGRLTCYSATKLSDQMRWCGKRAHFPFFAWLDTSPRVFLFLQALLRLIVTGCVWKWHYVPKCHSVWRRTNCIIWCSKLPYSSRLSTSPGWKWNVRGKASSVFYGVGNFDCREN